ncbi:MAG TPA: DUF4845 domain-containing protein [Casimicrobiaceae bacterium]|nr:DUF4845 domain-containing protein [Casimicrobiaceae bacterium]
MSNRQRQGGLSIIGFMFVAAVVVVMVMIGFRMVPAYVEWLTVQKILATTLEESKEGFSLYQFRRDFDRKAGADYIDSVRASDVTVTKEGNDLVATASWTRTLHLIGNVSLLLEFEATAKK